MDISDNAAFTLIWLGCVGVIFFGLVSFWDGGPNFWGLALALVAALVAAVFYYLRVKETAQ